MNSSFTLNTPIAGIIFPIPSSGTTNASSNFTHLGWTVGGGLEYAFDRNWSIAGEYRYSDFGSRSVTVANTDPAGFGSLGIFAQTISTRLRTDEATLRLNYRFDAGPVWRATKRPLHAFPIGPGSPRGRLLLRPADATIAPVPLQMKGHRTRENRIKFAE